MSRSTRMTSIKIRAAILFILVFMISIIFFKVLVSAKEKETISNQYKYYTSVQIQSGDTLWNIAKRYCPEEAEINTYVNEIKEINHLQSDEIHSGKYLTIIYYSDEYK